MDELYDFTRDKRSLSLEQALWHMERILSIRSSLDNQNLFSNEMQLNFLSALLSSSQKFIEQLYNFLLINKGESPLDVHNLRICHLKAFPSAVTFPAAVNILYNANNWTRYFYAIEMQLQSMTTQNVPVPLHVKDLVSLADEKWKGSIHERMQNIFNLTIEHGKMLLDLKKTDSGEIGKAKGLKSDFTLQHMMPSDIVNGPLALLEQTTSSLNLTREDHASTHLLQACAALKMLRASLGEWNRSKNHMDLVTWTAWSLQQLQESLENTLRAAAALHNIPLPGTHELGAISIPLGIEPGELSEDLGRLSWKPRYPVKFRDVENKTARIIDQIEALRQHPDIEEGFTVTRDPSSTKLWEVIPREAISTRTIKEDLLNILDRGLNFLTTVAQEHLRP